MLQMRHNAQALRVMVEAAHRFHRFTERVFASMAERRMTEIVG